MGVRVRVVADSAGMAGLRRRMEEITADVTEQVADDMRRFVPKDTWDLHNSIQQQRTGELVDYVEFGGDSTESGPGAYWDSVEYGQRSNPSYPEQPYARPAAYKARVIG